MTVLLFLLAFILPLLFKMEHKDHGNDTTIAGSLYNTARQSVMAYSPPELASSINREFHPLFTFMVVLPYQLFFLVWILSGEQVDEPNFLHDVIFANLGIGAILLGGAALRCLLGYLISGKVKNIYDYQDEPSSVPDTASRKSGSAKKSGKPLDNKSLPLQ